MLSRFLAALTLCAAIAFNSSGALAAARVALVIGNDAYTALLPLRNSVADARAVGVALESLGFRVFKGENLNYKATNRLHADFEAAISPGDTAFVFFAGHGVALGAENYLLPTDMQQPRPGEENLVRTEAHAADTLIRRVQSRGAAASFFVFDACRDNPFGAVGVRNIGSSRGLARTEAPTGVFVLFSAGIGQTALDRLNEADRSPNSVFTRTLVPLLTSPGLTHLALAKRVQTAVKALALSVSHPQQPAFYDQIDGEIIFNEAALPKAEPAPAPPAPSVEATPLVAPPASGPRGWLGVRIQHVTDEIAESLGLKPTRGVLVVDVDDKGPAKPAGIESGDVIITFNGREIKELRDVPSLVAETPPGTAVRVGIIRKGKEDTKTVWLGRLAEDPAAAAEPVEDASVVQKMLGLQLAGMSNNLRGQYKIKDGVKGVVVTAVDPNSNAAEKGLVEGHTIMEVGQQKVATILDVQKRLDQLQKDGRKAVLLLLSNPEGEVSFIALSLK